MVVHPSLEDKGLSIFYLLVLSSLSICINPWDADLVIGIFVIMIFILLDIVAAIFAVSSWKTCEYTDQGCTISILCYHKTYLWSEIKSKYYDSFAGASMRGTYSQLHLDDGIFFSTHKYKRSHRTPPDQYAALHPLSSFYVIFPPDYLNETEEFLGLKIKHGPPGYMVDRDKFLALLESWGVELTDIRDTRPPRNQ